MNIYFIIYFICCTFYFTTAIITIINNRKNSINILFFIICVNLSSWSLMLGLMSLSTDVNNALLFRRLMVISWSTLYAEILFFVLLLTKNKSFYNRIWKVILIILPAIISSYLYYFFPVTTNDFVKLKQGWAYLIPSDRSFFWDQFFNFYYISYMILSLYLLYQWIKKSHYEREKRQGTIIFKAFIYILISGSIVDIVLPILGITLLSPISIIVSTGAIGGMCYAIIVYRMMNITPENIMLDVYKRMTEGILIVDSQNKVLSLNSGGETILGYDTKEIEGKQLETIFMLEEDTLLTFTENFSSTEVKFKRKDNYIGTVLMSGFYHLDQFNNKVGTVYTFQDIDKLKSTQMALEESRSNLEDKIDRRTMELKVANEKLKGEIKSRMKNEEKIHELAYNDQLTGLPNRRYFYNKLDQVMETNKLTSDCFAILFMDLDGFKMVNDTLGHDKGDEILKLVAKRLRHSLRDMDLVCRVGGDEFLILIENFNNLKELEHICHKLNLCLQSPFITEENTVYVKSSIGVACYPENGLIPDDLIKHADIAMYKAKDKGKNRCVFFDEEMKKGIDETMYLSNDLYRAFEEGELELFYQPQVNTITHEITGFEALLRWNHQSLGMISPVKFIPLAERNGLIEPIGEWVIQTAAIQQTKWKDIFGLDVTMGINLSMKQLKSDKLEAIISKTISETGVEPSKLEFEITESIFMDDTELIIQKLTRMKALGIKISIDDFGTEYSSLSYLKMLPIDRIKLPKPFIDGINLYPKDDAIISSLILLAKKLGCSVIAEGVEKEDQLNYLMQSECDDIQGFYFYKPVCVKQLDEILLLNLKEQQVKINI